ncbi:uncharacterized protein LOC143449963 isoform X1 [Clavelina lepadiformis]|uniref:uncharacterized protein LOC143449963 isoform X1 n=1 Tax=Clavelina lepadiformis TaxID=159417 RepID=UPI004042E9F5
MLKICVFLLTCWIHLNYFRQTLANECPGSFLSLGTLINGKLQNDGICYFLRNEFKDQSTAFAWCRSNFRGYLARISDLEEFEAIARNIGTNTDFIWFDLKCDVTNCTWSDGSYVGDATLQRRLESSGRVGCGALKNTEQTDRYTKWELESCSAYHPFLCQVDQVIQDFDNCGENNSFAFNGKCFELLKTRLNWEDAKQACARRHADLAGLDTQELAILTANYMNSESITESVWIKSLISSPMSEFSQGLFMSRGSGAAEFVDEHTGWFTRTSISRTRQIFALCETGDPPVTLATTAATTQPTTLDANRTENNSTKETTTLVITLVETTSSNAPVSAIIVPAVVVSLFVFILLICAAILFFKPQSMSQTCERFGKCNWLHRKSNTPDLIPPITASESEFFARNGRRSDRVNRSDHSYFQIAGPAGENVYASIDSNPVESDQTYAQIESRHVIEDRSSPLSYAEGQASDQRERNESSRSRTNTTITTVSANNPAYHVNELKPLKSPPSDGATGNSAQVNYASLQLSPDEDALASSSVQYARLFLYDEDEKYQEEQPKS